MSVPWQERARLKDWSEEEIRRIENLMKIGRSHDTVIRVTAWEITVRSIEDGMNFSWKWRKFEYPEPKTATNETAIPWCPVHGDQCDPSEEGCGLERIVYYVPCECPPRGHFHDCDIMLWKEEARKKLLEPKPPEPEIPRIRKNDYTPKAVQLRLDLSVPETPGKPKEDL